MLLSTLNSQLSTLNSRNLILGALLGLPALPLAASVTLDIAEGSLVITETGYSQGGATETSFTGSYVITQSCTRDNGSSCDDTTDVDYDPDYEKSTDYTITIKSGTHELTLEDVGIYGDGSPAVQVQSGAMLNLTLEGENLLEGDDEYAGLNVPSGATLTITEGSTGYLYARGDGAAGIGGSSGETAGSITIAGGTILAVGRGAAYSAGAGIGGGPNGNGGTITITGGFVAALSSFEGSDAGAGIGGGYKGDGGTIKISGGCVHAFTSGESDVAGTGIGGGKGGNGGAVTITGGTVVTDRIGGGEGGDGETIEISGGIVIVEDAVGKGEDGSDDGDITIGEGALFVLAPESETIKLSDYMSSTSFSVEGDAVWPAGYRLYIDSAYAFTLEEGSLLTNYDTIFVHGSLGAGSVLNNGVIVVYGSLEADSLTIESANAYIEEICDNNEYFDLTLTDGALIVYGTLSASSIESDYAIYDYGTLSAGSIVSDYAIYDYGTLSAGSIVNNDTIWVYGSFTYDELENNGVIINKTFAEGLMALWGSDTVTFDSSEISLGTVVLSEDFTLDSGYVLVVGSGQTLNINATFTIASGATLVNDGGSVIVSGTLVIEGSYEGSYTLTKTGSVTTSSESGESPIAASAKIRTSKISGTELGIKVYANSAVRASVFNLKGELLKTQHLNAGEATIGGLNPGVYLVKLSDGSKGLVNLR